MRANGFLVFENRRIRGVFLRPHGGLLQKNGPVFHELMSSIIKSTIDSIINRTLELRHVHHSRQ